MRMESASQTKVWDEWSRILDCLCNGYTLLYTVRVKNTSPVDIYWNAIFVILYNIIALHHNANVFSIEIK